MALETTMVDVFRLIEERVHASVEEMHALYRKLQRFIVDNADKIVTRKIKRKSWKGRLGGIDGSEQKIERRGIVIVGVSASGIVMSDGDVERYRQFDVTWLNGFAQEDVSAFVSISRQFMERYMQLHIGSRCDLLLVDGPPYPHGMTLDAFVSSRSITSRYGIMWSQIYGEDGLMESFINLNVPHAYIIKSSESNEYLMRTGIRPDEGLSRLRDIDLMNMILPPANEQYIIISEPRPVSVERIRLARKRLGERYRKYIDEMYFFYMRASGALPIRVEIHRDMLPRLNEIVNAIVDSANMTNNIPWVLEMAHEHSQIDNMLLHHVANRIMKELFMRVKDEAILNMFAPVHGTEQFWTSRY